MNEHDPGRYARSSTENVKRYRGSLRAVRFVTFALPPAPSRRAEALEIADAVDAGPAETARIRSALVDVDLAVGAGEADGAFAQEPVGTVDALPAVVAGVRVAVVDVVLAVDALEAVAADAGVVVSGVDAGSAVLAGVRAAGLEFGDVAGRAFPVGRAVADVGAS